MVAQNRLTQITEPPSLWQMAGTEILVEAKARKILCGDRELQLGSRTFVMGILNVTPDSFSDGGMAAHVDQALHHADRLLREGADILDIGGESTRPGAEPVAVETEIRRVMPVVESLVARGVRNLSVDTRNAETARRALAAGVSWLNDVSAFTHDEQMLSVAPVADAVVLMHAKGTPKTMQKGKIQYDDVVKDISMYLQERVRVAAEAGISKERILVDPGIGFGKTLAHNLAVARHLSTFRGESIGVLFGPSRKKFLGELTGIGEPKERDAATLGALCASVFTGADIVRVHDVKSSVEALRIADAICRASHLNTH